MPNKIKHPEWESAKAEVRKKYPLYVEAQVHAQAWKDSPMSRPGQWGEKAKQAEQEEAAKKTA
jgi:hypothetical protein